MKNIVIIRHAKAEALHNDESDFDRKLTERGKKNAAEVAKILSVKNIRPEVMISSPAKRALRTAKIFADRFDMKKSAVITKDFLYADYSMDEIVKMLSEEFDSFGNVFIIGHNPVIVQLISSFCTSFEADFPTSAATVIAFDVDNWNEIKAGSGKQLLFELPSKKK